MSDFSFLRRVTVSEAFDVIDEQLVWDNAAIQAGGLVGRCNLCEATGLLVIEHPVLRETVRCQGCGSFSRQRALGKLFEARRPHYDVAPKVLLLESSGALFRSLRRRQFRGEIKLAAAEYGASDDRRQDDPFHPSSVLNLDLCHPAVDEQFDLLLHLDILEHVADPASALHGTARLLAPGGRALFTAPLEGPNNRHSRRAAIDDEGAIVYLQEAVYHGDPNPDAPDRSGVLVFTDLGLLDLVEQAEQVDLRLVVNRVWSPEIGVLGQAQIVMELVKT